MNGSGPRSFTGAGVCCETTTSGIGGFVVRTSIREVTADSTERLFHRLVRSCSNVQAVHQPCVALRRHLGCTASSRTRDGSRPRGSLRQVGLVPLDHVFVIVTTHARMQGKLPIARIAI